MKAIRQNKVSFYITSFFTLFLITLSIIFFCISIEKIKKSELHLSFSNSYPFLCEYSGIYKFTFVVVAIYFTSMQLAAAQEANQKTLDQLNLTQTEINDKRKIEETNSTLLECKYYLTEIQESFERLTVTGSFDGSPINYPFEKVTNEALANSENLLKKIEMNVKKSKKEILFTLNKYEAFAALFNHGNLDLNLGKKIIGTSYIGQTELLLPLIAFFRPNDASPFFNNILHLRKIWLENISEDGINF